MKQTQKCSWYLNQLSNLSDCCRNFLTVFLKIWIEGTFLIHSGIEIHTLAPNTLIQEALIFVLYLMWWCPNNVWYYDYGCRNFTEVIIKQLVIFYSLPDIQCKQLEMYWFLPINYIIPVSLNNVSECVFHLLRLMMHIAFFWMRNSFSRTAILLDNKLYFTTRAATRWNKHKNGTIDIKILNLVYTVTL